MAKWSPSVMDRVIQLACEGKTWVEIGADVEVQRPGENAAAMFSISASTEQKAVRSAAIRAFRRGGGRPIPIAQPLAPATPRIWFDSDPVAERDIGSSRASLNYIS